MDLRADVGGLVPRVALAQRASPVEEPRGELLGDRRLDQQPAAGEADLAGVVVLLHGVGHGQVEVRVGEDQQRRLPAQLQRDGGQVGGGRGGDVPGGGDRAGEADPGHVRVGDQRGADLLAVPLDHVEHPVRQPRLGRDVGQQRRGQRRPLGRLQHHRVPGRERRRDLPRGEHQRGVPRRDQRAHPGRVPAHVVAVATGLEVRMAQPDQPVGEEAEVVRHPGHHAAPVRAQQRAVVGGLDLGELLQPLLDAVRDRVQQRGALLPARAGPGRERPAGRLDGGVGVAGPAARDLGEDRAVDRREVGEHPARPAAFPADPLSGVDFRAGDGDRIRHPRPLDEKIVRDQTYFSHRPPSTVPASPGLRSMCAL